MGQERSARLNRWLCENDRRMFRVADGMSGTPNSIVARGQMHPLG